MEMSGSLCPRSLQVPRGSNALGGIKLKPGGMALCSFWARCPSSLGVLALQAPPQCSQMDSVAESRQLLLIEFLS